jgi:hypothetical protein
MAITAADAPRQEQEALISVAEATSEPRKARE